MGLESYINRICASLESVPGDRRIVLDKAVGFIQARVENSEVANLIFICTHNSRRSHLGQAWCHVAADYYGVKGIGSWSGGTEATACNIRTIEALKRAGLPITDSTGGENPVYQLELPSNKLPLGLYSKTYYTSENPQSGYAGMMCCSDVDEKCPVIYGADLRIPLHYRDPKESDDTPDEAMTYDRRCFEIAIEMFYILSRVAG